VNPLELLAELKTVMDKAKDASNPNGPGGEAWTPREIAEFTAASLHALADLAATSAPFLPNS
jgi:hypothetical protein